VKSAVLRGFLAIVFALAAAGAVAAGTISGVVHNGTTGKPVARQDVILFSLQSGMQPVGTVQTNAQGSYTFDRPEIGQGPMMVRVPYHGVNYHQPAPPGKNSIDVEVYEASARAADIQLSSQTIIFQPNGPKLLVGEEFVLQNHSSPPATFSDPNGSFVFELPPGAQLGQVSASGPAGMPVAQGTIGKGKNRYAIAFALKPGENNIRVSYEFPYDGNQAAIRAVAAMPAQRILLAAPVGVQVSGDGFSPAGTEQGFNIATRENVAAGSTFGVTVSGFAPPPSPGGDGAQGEPAAQGGAAGGQTLQPLSPRLGSFQWILLGGMGAFFLLGFFFLMRQPRAAAVPAGDFTATAAPSVPVARGKSSRVPAPTPAAAAPSSAAPTTLREVERSVSTSLDELKDTLFRLELRHQAATISDEEYGQERARLEALLRQFVRG
jgi:hypothetical protein